MNLRRLLGAALLVLGVLALVYRTFSVPTERHTAKLGPLELSVQEKERVSVPTWLGVAALVAGGALLLVPGRR